MVSTYSMLATISALSSSAWAQSINHIFHINAVWFSAMCIVVHEIILESWQL